MTAEVVRHIRRFLSAGAKPDGPASLRHTKKAATRVAAFRCDLLRKERDSKCGALAGQPLRIEISPPLLRECRSRNGDVRRGSEACPAGKVISPCRAAERKNDGSYPPLRLKKSGKRGIRTPGTSRFNGFQDRRNRPLCHLSGSKSSTLFSYYQIPPGNSPRCSGGLRRRRSRK